MKYKADSIKAKKAPAKKKNVTAKRENVCVPAIVSPSFEKMESRKILYK